MPEKILTLSLVSDAAQVSAGVILTLGALLGLSGLFGRHRKPLTVIGSIILVSVATTGVYVFLERIWRPFPDHVPLKIWLSCGVTAFVIFCIGFQPYKRIALTITSILCLLATGIVFNSVYRQYNDMDSLLPQKAALNLTAEQVQQYRDRKEQPEIDGKKVGAIVTLALPSTASGFTHRPEMVYLPPAYFADPDYQPDVVVLLGGNPGSPDQWFNPGQGTITLAHWAAQHDGKAPVVVTADATGSLTANPLCIDGVGGNVQTYLNVDVPNGIMANFHVKPFSAGWTIGGLSYGATCALQTALLQPQNWRSVALFSPQAEPTIGDHGQTIQKFFNGDELAYDAISPGVIMRLAAQLDEPEIADQVAQMDEKVNAPAATNTQLVQVAPLAQRKEKYQGMRLLLVAGKDDRDAVVAERGFDAQARALGMSTKMYQVEGGHDFTAWQQGLASAISWLDPVGANS